MCTSKLHHRQIFSCLVWIICSCYLTCMFLHLVCMIVGIFTRWWTRWHIYSLGNIQTLTHMQCTHTVAAMAASVSLTVCLPHPTSSLDISGNKLSALPENVFSGLSVLRFAYTVHNSTMCVACVVACVSVHEFSHLLQGSPRMRVYLSFYKCPVFTRQSIYRGGVCLCDNRCMY